MNPLKTLALALALVAAGPALRAEQLDIELQPMHFTTNATLKSFRYQKGSFMPERYSIVATVVLRNGSERDWEYVLPEGSAQVVGPRNVLVYTDPQGRRFALAKDTPFAAPGNLLIHVAGVDLVVGQWWSDVKLRIDTEVDPPMASDRDGVVRANFTALEAALGL